MRDGDRGIKLIVSVSVEKREVRGSSAIGTGREEENVPVASNLCTGQVGLQVSFQKYCESCHFPHHHNQPVLCYATPSLSRANERASKERTGAPHIEG